MTFNNLSSHPILRFAWGPARMCALAMMMVSIIVSVRPGPHGKNPLISVGSMHELRGSHTATLLPSGNVLIVGGFKKIRTYDQAYFSSAELYDPQTKTFIPTGNLNVARCGHTATLLRDGTVLIAGGGNDQPLSSAELYDPKTGTFTLVGEMAVPRQGHTATLFKNGNVLIAGGGTDDKHSAELFNAMTHRFEATGNLTSNRLGHTATLLPDGNVLIAGGATGEERDHKVFASAELYNPTTGKFTNTGSMTMVRYKHGAILLPDSTVLIVGGSDESDWRGQYNNAELYDTKRGAFARTRDMEGKRFKLPNGITLLNDGTVLVSGGGRKVEIYDPKTRSFSSVGQFEEPHFYETATLLPDGSVLIAGGYNTEPQSTDKAWIYKKM
ncbi:MAG: hypothetical protein HYR76_07305 [Ignavibacteria bacterium]|nr:hypothetical protein [Ignavibacteria bacterium]